MKCVPLLLNLKGKTTQVECAVIYTFLFNSNIYNNIVCRLYPDNCPTQMVVNVKVEHQLSVLKSPFAGVIMEVEGIRGEASLK